MFAVELAEPEVSERLDHEEARIPLTPKVRLLKREKPDLLVEVAGARVTGVRV